MPPKLQPKQSEFETKDKLTIPIDCRDDTQFKDRPIEHDADTAPQAKDAEVDASSPAEEYTAQLTKAQDFCKEKNYHAALQIILELRKDKKYEKHKTIIAVYAFDYAFKILLDAYTAYQADTTDNAELLNDMWSKGKQAIQYAIPLHKNSSLSLSFKKKYMPLIARTYLHVASYHIIKNEAQHAYDHCTAAINILRDLPLSYSIIEALILAYQYRISNFSMESRYKIQDLCAIRTLLASEDLITEEKQENSFFNSAQFTKHSDTSNAQLSALYSDIAEKYYQKLAHVDHESYQQMALIHQLWITDKQDKHYTTIRTTLTVLAQRTNNALSREFYEHCIALYFNDHESMNWEKEFSQRLPEYKADTFYQQVIWSSLLNNIYNEYNHSQFTNKSLTTFLQNDTPLNTLKSITQALQKYISQLKNISKNLVNPYEKTTQLLDELLVEFPHDPQVYWFKGFFYGHQLPLKTVENNYKKAIHYLELSLNLNGSRFGLHEILCTVYKKNKNTLEKSIYHNKKALDLACDPYDVTNLSNALIDTYLELANFELALSTCNDMIEKNPPSALSLETKAIILMKMERHQEAIEFAKQALTLSPNDTATQSTYQQVTLALAMHHKFSSAQATKKENTRVEKPHAGQDSFAKAILNDYFRQQKQHTLPVKQAMEILTQFLKATHAQMLNDDIEITFAKCDKNFLADWALYFKTNNMLLTKNIFISALKQLSIPNSIITCQTLVDAMLPQIQIQQKNATEASSINASHSEKLSSAYNTSSSPTHANARFTLINILDKTHSINNEIDSLLKRVIHPSTLTIDISEHELIHRLTAHFHNFRGEIDVQPFRASCAKIAKIQTTMAEINKSINDAILTNRSENETDASLLTNLLKQAQENLNILTSYRAELKKIVHTLEHELSVDKRIPSKKIIQESILSKLKQKKAEREEKKHKSQEIINRITNPKKTNLVDDTPNNSITKTSLSSAATTAVHHALPRGRSQTTSATRMMPFIQEATASRLFSPERKRSASQLRISDHVEAAFQKQAFSISLQESLDEWKKILTTISHFNQLSHAFIIPYALAGYIARSFDKIKKFGIPGIRRDHAKHFRNVIFHDYTGFQAKVNALEPALITLSLELFTYIESYTTNRMIEQKTSESPLFNVAMSHVISDITDPQHYHKTIDRLEAELNAIKNDYLQTLTLADSNHDKYSLQQLLIMAIGFVYGQLGVCVSRLSKATPNLYATYPHYRQYRDIGNQFRHASQFTFTIDHHQKTSIENTLQSTTANVDANDQHDSSKASYKKNYHHK